MDSVNVGFGGFDEDHYAECYPGYDKPYCIRVIKLYSGMEEMDATVNSDDEADFTKMDMVCYIFFLSTFPLSLSLSLSLSQGNRKGPVKRWDFDTDEDYGNYQSSREALPKYCALYFIL